MIVVENVFKNFGTFKVLRDINFRISQGEIIGFLGQNGAGKTTLMRILTGCYQPSTGKIGFEGEDYLKVESKIKRSIGYLPETPPLYPELTISEYLRFVASLREIPAKNFSREIDRVVSVCDLKKDFYKSIGILSKGLKQRVGIAQAIIHDPKLLILDEPTSGLDPVQNLSIRKLIKDLEYKRTVILSTHILSEIEQIAKRVIVLRAGQIIVDKPLGKWIAESSSKNIEECFIKTVGDGHV